MKIPTILKGDDAGAITLALDSSHSYDGATLVVAYQGETKTFTGLAAGGTVSLVYNHAETATFRLGCYPMEARLIGAGGSVETVSNAEWRIKVTDIVSEVNCGGSFAVVPGAASVPVTDVEELGGRYKLADLAAKIDEVCRILAQRTAPVSGPSAGPFGAVALALLFSLGAFAANVQTARLDDMYNDERVVTNVTFEGLATPGAVSNIVTKAYVEDLGITATKEYVDRRDGEIAALSTNIVTNATNALAQAVATNSAAIATIDLKIPSAASASNQLADKEWIDDEIDTYAAYYITYTAAGAAFPTRAALTNATVVYSGGAARTPTRNDYAVVLADESHGGAEWRYIYTVAAGATSGQWEAQYPIETNDYDALSNKPQINGISLSGNKTGADLGVLDLAGGTMTETLVVDTSQGLYCVQLGAPTHSGYPHGDGVWWRDSPSSLLGPCGIYCEDLTGRMVIVSEARTIYLPHAAGTLALASEISAAISPTSPAFSNAVLSVGLGIDTNTVAVINELVDSAHDLPVTGATSVGALLLALAAAIAALKKRLPYAISESIPLTVTSGAASTTLDDRTHNVRTVAAPGSGNTTTITATLPPIVQGKSRDMFLNLTVGSAASDAGDISLSIVEPSGATAQIDIGSVEDIGVGENEIMLFERALPTTEIVNNESATTTHWQVTVRHEDFT